MLGKFEWEILNEMPPNEYVRWVAYLNVKNKRERAEAAKARGRSATRGQLANARRDLNRR